MRLEKIFGTGVQRTGTMSLTRALVSLGIPARQFVPELSHNIRHDIVRRYRAFTDFPVPLLYRQLDAAYPGSKFIHTVRDESDWLDSVEWLFTRGATKFNWRANPVFDQMHLAFYGTTSFDPERFLKRYREYNAEVIDYFGSRPGNFLLVDVTKGDAFDSICPFLGIPVPKQPFPHSNRSESLPIVLGRRLLRVLKSRR